MIKLELISSVSNREGQPYEYFVDENGERILSDKILELVNTALDPPTCESCDNFKTCDVLYVSDCYNCIHHSILKKYRGDKRHDD